MLTKENLQSAIDVAAKGNLAAVAHDAFEFSLTEGWKPRPGCLSAHYSSGEAVICAILMQFYFMTYGRPEYVVLPINYEFDNSATDLIWPGAWYLCSAVGSLSDKTSWDAIKMLLPGK